jgi:hypothetical protein
MDWTKYNDLFKILLENGIKTMKDSDGIELANVQLNEAISSSHPFHIKRILPRKNCT